MKPAMRQRRCALVSLLGAALGPSPSTFAAMASDADPLGPVHALLVGCGRYTPFASALQLPGAEADVALMRSTLRRMYGARLQLRVLDSADTAQPPTHHAILQALDTWAETTPAGATGWLYLAGHGTQRPQAPPGGGVGRYAEPDGQDELFLPIDCGRWQEGKGQVARSIRDDEIQQRLQRLRSRGLSVVAMFDTCHAAGMDRSASAVPAVGSRVRSVPVSLLGGPTMPARAPSRGPSANANRALARDLDRQTLLYACRAHEQTYEADVLDATGRRHRHGIFTWHFAAAWIELQRQQAGRWRLGQLQQILMDRYAAEQRPHMNPQLLGSATVLGGAG